MSWTKLAIVAGAGDLPVRIAEHCRATGKACFISGVDGFTDGALAAFPGETLSIGEMGARLASMKRAGCDAIVFAGGMKRPDFSKLKLDARGMMLLPKVMAASGKGDDALLRVLVDECEKEGFKVVGADDVLGALKAPPGPLGRHAPNARDLADIKKAAAVVAALGQWDIGQGVVVCEQLVLAVEALEGTDAMLDRVATLPAESRGSAEARRGVLLKRPKPQQERRIDLPTIGAATIERAARAGLAGVAVEAQGALVMERDRAVALADEHGLFIYGFTDADL